MMKSKNNQESSDSKKRHCIYIDRKIRDKLDEIGLKLSEFVKGVAEWLNLVDKKIYKGEIRPNHRPIDKRSPK